MTFSTKELKRLSDEKVNRVKDFFQRFLCHTKGAWAGVEFQLLPWQNELIEKTFGTLKPDGNRQYRYIYVEIPKKNGKTEIASGLALYGLCGDGEIGAEIYSAAGDREQAGLVYLPASWMVKNNAMLKKRLHVLDSRKRIIYEKTGSFYQVLSSEAFTKHGLNPHFVIIDELHAQPNRELYDVLTEGTDTAREQQLVIIITTAGLYDKLSIGWEVHNYALQVRDGIIDDPTFLPIIYSIEEDEDVEDRKVWERVNPSLNHIFTFDKLETHYKQSAGNPIKWNNFLRYRLNKWVGQIERYIPMQDWDACNNSVDPEKLTGRPCFGGLDLSSSVDLSAFVLIFPPMKDGEKYKVIPHLYVPEERIIDRSRQDNVPYDIWSQGGYINAVPGNVIDYAFIRADIEKAMLKYDLREIAFDRWGSQQIAIDLEENLGIEMVMHGQGFADMSGPTKEILNFIMRHEFAHGGHPVLRWNADNLATKQDAAENYKPDKKQSRERIDGLVAMIMAFGRCLANPELKSVYEDRGILFI